MTPPAALLAAVLADPSADEPRLVLADWLDEHGESEHAEFIRVQCRLAYAEPFSGMCVDCKTGEYLVPTTELIGLRRRERELWEARALSWLPRPLMDLEAERTARACVYRRGFVSEVTMTLTDWLAHGPEIVPVAPIEKVRISDREPWPGRNSVVTWWRDVGIVPNEDDTSDLPDKVFQHLEGEPNELSRLRTYHPSPQAAHDALSQACLTWARNASKRDTLHVP